MTWRRACAMQSLGITRTPRDPAPPRTGCLWKIRFEQRWTVAGSQAKPANKDGESEIRWLPKLAVEQGEKSGTVEHERKNHALPELPKAEQTEAEGQDCAPQKIGHPENWPALQDYAAP